MVHLKTRSVFYQPEDLKICEQVFSLPYGKRDTAKSLNDLLIQVGKYFIGAPYVADTLDREGEEALVVNLRQFDCFTFLENVIVLARLIEIGKTGFNNYKKQLKIIRYRKGRLKGYASRLHYFSDWLYDNEQKGLMKDITGMIGGKQYTKEIRFMTQHPENYPPLKDKKLYNELLVVEKRISGKTGHVVSKAEFIMAEPKIENGNVIGIATDIEGLDVTHVGFAVWIGNHVYLLHASQEEKKVVVSKRMLGEYLDGNESISGVIIAKVRSIPETSGENSYLNNC